MSTVADLPTTVSCQSKPMTRIGGGKHLQFAEAERLAGTSASDRVYVLRPMALEWELVTLTEAVGVALRYLHSTRCGVCRGHAELLERILAELGDLPLDVERKKFNAMMEIRRTAC